MASEPYKQGGGRQCAVVNCSNQKNSTGVKKKEKRQPRSLATFNSVQVSLDTNFGRKQTEMDQIDTSERFQSTIYSRGRCKESSFSVF